MPVLHELSCFNYLFQIQKKAEAGTKKILKNDDQEDQEDKENGSPCTTSQCSI